MERRRAPGDPTPTRRPTQGQFITPAPSTGPFSSSGHSRGSTASHHGGYTATTPSRLSAGSRGMHNTTGRMQPIVHSRTTSNAHRGQLRQSNFSWRSERQADRGSPANTSYHSNHSGEGHNTSNFNRWPRSTNANFRHQGQTVNPTPPTQALPTHRHQAANDHHVQTSPTPFRMGGSHVAQSMMPQRPPQELFDYNSAYAYHTLGPQPPYPGFHPAGHIPQMAPVM